MTIDKAELASYLAEDVYCAWFDIESAVCDAVSWEVKDEYSNEELDQFQLDVEAMLENMIENPEDYVSFPIYTYDIRQIWEENENDINDYLEPWMIEDCDTIGRMISKAVNYWLSNELMNAFYEIQGKLDLEGFINESVTA